MTLHESTVCQLSHLEPVFPDPVLPRMSNNNSSLKKLPLQHWDRFWLPAKLWEQQSGMDEDFLTGVGGARASDFGFSEPLPEIGGLKAFAEVPFLLLLGRPGAGKSQEMQAAWKEGWLGSPSVLILGKETGSSDPVPYIQEAIEAAAAPEGRAGLRILIDGLDEALLQNPSFIPQLARWLRLRRDSEGRPLYRLAISCRWADWPEAEIKDLAALWSDADSKKLVLCPLSHLDATNTLVNRYGDTVADRFWNLMRERHLQPVACWPQGFTALMESFGSKDCQDLPQSLGDATADQIQRHCRLADSPDDTVRWRQSVHGPDWRQRVAGRVAAAMIWSGKPSLVVDPAPFPGECSSLTLADLTHTDERWADGRKAITLEDLDHLLHRTGLLKRMSDNTRWMFQSQVYQEWLAADWLRAQQLEEAKLHSLFGSAGEAGWRVFPALKSVAAWLARMDGSFRALLLQEDPLVLLRLDAASLPAKDRKDIVEAILKATHRAHVVDTSVWQSHLYSLVHDGLDTQLRQWLENENTHGAAKEMAVVMAEKTGLTSLAPYLWDLYPRTRGHLQTRIANALYDLAKNQVYDSHWKSVLDGAISNDEDATMLGAALEILVIERKSVPVRDVLDWIVPRIRFNVIGLYDIVIGRTHDHLTVEDLPAVFAKLAEDPGRLHDYDSEDTAKSFNQKALEMAFQYFDRPEVASALVSYWHACTKIHVYPHHGLNSGWTPESIGLANDVRRKEIIQTLIHHPAFEKHTERKWVWPDNYLFIESDFEWCLDEILAAPSDEEEWRYALVVRHYLDLSRLSGAIANKLDRAWHKSAFLRSLLPTPRENKNVWETILEDTALQQQERQIKVDQGNLGQTQTVAIFNERINNLARTCKEGHEKGDIVWPGVLRLLGARHHGPGSYTVNFGPETEVREDENWMRDAARRYLIERPSNETLEHNDGICAAFALAVCPEELKHPGPVREAVSAHWVPPLLRMMSTSFLEKETIGLSRRNLAALFPESFSRAFGQIMRHRYANQGSLSELQSFQAYWTLGMTHELSTFLKEDPPQTTGFATALRYLFAASPSSALAVAEHWLAQFPQIQDLAVRAAIVGASAIMFQGRLSSQISDHLSDQEFTAMALKSGLGSLGYSDVRMDMTEWSDLALKQLADAAWLAFPKMKSRGYGGGWVTNNDLTIEFRSHITNACIARGLLVNIPVSHADDTPEEAETRQVTLDWNLHATRQVQAGAAWQFITPGTFFKLAHQPHARLARNNDELMQAVIECLRRWEASLDSGSWDHLWDVSTFKSRPEKRIAREMRDWLKRELHLMVECEVELATEKRTDILVQTLSKDTSTHPLTVVIELKKHRAGNAGERRNAMKTQLLNRYLRQRFHEGWTHGLYVIAWTPLPASSADSQVAIQQASNDLEVQSAKLSSPPFRLKSMVIDARYRDQAAIKAKEKKNTLKKATSPPS